MILTIGGLPGAGKSTIKNLLAKHFGWKAYSMGDMRGAYALEHGLTIDELNAQGLNDKTSDTLVDEFQAALGKREDNFIIDGWLSWHFIPHSVKLLLTIDPHEGAKRIMNEQRHTSSTRRDEKIYTSITEAEQTLANRIAQNHARYQKWYGIENFLDPTHYDLVLDTTHKTPEAILEEIIRHTSVARA